MDLMERLSSFGDIVQVVCRSDGARLGPLAEVRIDPTTATVTTVSFHERIRDSFVALPEIEVLGDIVLVPDREGVRSATPGLPGHPLREYAGRLVRTIQGTRIGRVADFGFDPRTKRIQRLFFSDGTALDVDAKDLVIQAETIVLPGDSLKSVRVRRPEESGLLARSLASRRLGEIAFGVRKALASSWSRGRADAA